MVGTGLGLPALLLAQFVRLDGGPVLFEQTRYSKGEPFEVLKIRSMYEGAEHDEPMWVGHDDPRATRVGRILRKTSLDEVPQIINVLRGDISMVGYRPPSERVQDRYSQFGQLYEEWLEMTKESKAGITGLAQQKAKRTPVHDADLCRQVMELDLRYAETASLALDLQIIAGTAGCMWERDAMRQSSLVSEGV